MNIQIHQLLYGYRRGHQLLANSISLSPNDSDLIERLSDLSGHLNKEIDFYPYITCFPLQSGDQYALSKTWLDKSVPRLGCVITHTLLIPMDIWHNYINPYDLNEEFKFPDDKGNLEKYQVVIEHEIAENVEDISLNPPRKNIAVEFVSKFHGEGIKPIIWLGEKHPEDIMWLILSNIWPDLRKQFSCCTLSLQLRELENQSFDLQFTPLNYYSRFQKIPRENFIGLATQDNSKNQSEREIEPWYHDWAVELFSQPKEYDEKRDIFGDIVLQLNSDPTNISKYFLLQKLHERVESSPTAAIGLLDVVESIIPEGEQGIKYKNKIVTLALESANQTTETKDALEYYYLISERLGRSAFNQVDVQKSYDLISSIAFLTSSSPSESLEIAERILAQYTNALNSFFINGLISGLKEIGTKYSEHLSVLKYFPNISPLIISLEPSIALFFLRGMKVNGDDYIQTDLPSWISSLNDSKVRRHLREILLPEISEEGEALIVEELLKDLDEKDVYSVLDTLFISSRGFSSKKIRQVVIKLLSNNYPRVVRSWANVTDKWTVETASVIAASYKQNQNGFEALLKSTFKDKFRYVQIITAFLNLLSDDRLPLWVRNIIKNDPSYIAPLLTLGRDSPQDVRSMIQRILDEVRDIPLSKMEELIDRINDFQDFSISDSLVNQTLRSAITGYILGDISWKNCKRWFQLEMSKGWILTVSLRDLQFILTRNCFNSTKTIHRAWKWVSLVSNDLLLRPQPILTKLVDIITPTNDPIWTKSISKSWITILNQSTKLADESTQVEMYAQALRFALDNENLPVEDLVVETFLKVYNSINGLKYSFDLSVSIFTYFDWDKRKHLHKKLINAFLKSDWPPGDLPHAVQNIHLLHRTFSGLNRSKKGRKFIQSIFEDLSHRKDKPSVKLLHTLKEIIGTSDFPEFMR